MDDADGDAKKPIVRRADLVPQYVYPTPPLPPPPVDPEYWSKGGANGATAATAVSGGIGNMAGVVSGMMPMLDLGGGIVLRRRSYGLNLKDNYRGRLEALAVSDPRLQRPQFSSTRSGPHHLPKWTSVCTCTMIPVPSTTPINTMATPPTVIVTPDNVDQWLSQKVNFNCPILLKSIVIDCQKKSAEAATASDVFDLYQYTIQFLSQKINSPAKAIIKNQTNLNVIGDTVGFEKGNDKKGNDQQGISEKEKAEDAKGNGEKENAKKGINEKENDAKVDGTKGNDSKGNMEYDAIRAGMDYNYFPRYTDTRISLQNSIITDILTLRTNRQVESGKVECMEKVGGCWLAYTCGCYGSGKSHTVRSLWADHLSGTVYIDPDVVKTRLCGEIQVAKMGNDELKALHLESTFISLMAERMVIARGWSAVIDGSLHDHSWYSQYFQKLRREHPEYRICLVNVECDIDMAIQRCQRRALQTKRTIPEILVRTIFEKIPIAFSKLAPLADCWISINNNVDHKTPNTTQIHINLFHKSNPPHHPPFLQPFL